MDSLPVPTSLVWLPAHLPDDQMSAELARAILPPRIRRRIESALQAPEPGRARRAAYALCDRLALPLACRDVLGAANLSALHLAHTPLGQPVPRWRGTEQGIHAGDLHISYTHDHDCHLTFAACSHGLKGVGVDIVHLPRLRSARKDRRYLESFARHFMSAEEFAHVLEASAAETEDAFRIRVAAHFSLMEAASKALGTGLKIGAGMGGPESLPKQSLGIRMLESAVEFLLASAARDRMAHLNATRLTGTWAEDGEYLVSAAILQ
jgi:phosphopantetheine--protein transferase-like protein